MGFERKRKFGIVKDLYVKNYDADTKLNVPQNKRRSSSFTEGVQVTRNQARNSCSQRRRSTFPYFAEAPDKEESEADEEEWVYRDHYRKVLRLIYEEEEREKWKRRSKLKRPVSKRMESVSPLDSFRQFLIDNEILVQILIVLPLVLTALYILLIEKGSLVNTSP